MTKPRLGRRRKDGNFFSLSLDFNQVFIRRLLRKILNSAIVWKLRTNFLLVVLAPTLALMKFKNVVCFARKKMRKAKRSIIERKPLRGFYSSFKWPLYHITTSTGKLLPPRPARVERTKAILYCHTPRKKSGGET